MENIVRERAFVILQRAFNITGIAQESEFLDNNDISDWAKSSIGIMAQCGFINGNTEANVLPKHNISRAEICSVVLRLMNTK